VNSSSRHRRPHKIRRSGRHAAPSQIQNVADKATKATPAMALAGVLVAAPHANAAAGAAVKTTTAVIQVHDDAVQSGARTAGANTAQARTDAVVVRAQASTQATRRYTVQRGDTLSSIAQRFYGSTGDWNRLFAANRSVLRNPNMIFPGQVLAIPGHLPVASTSPASHGGSTQVTTASMLSGTLSCGGLEELWEQAGGSSGEAVTAASIAMAESSGQQFATGGVGERGYWQINPNHGSLSTYDPLGNAKAAVIISDDGQNWSPWTTFTSGAFRGRC
jgi:LysM repeat protein